MAIRQRPLYKRLLIKGRPLTRSLNHSIKNMLVLPVKTLCILMKTITFNIANQKDVGKAKIIKMLTGSFVYVTLILSKTRSKLEGIFVTLSLGSSFSLNTICRLSSNLCFFFKICRTSTVISGFLKPHVCFMYLSFLSSEI